MKRNLYSSLFLLLLAFSSHAQISSSYCGSARYDQEVFSAYDSVMTVTYGSSITSTGATQTLTMNVYWPHGDTAIMRPMIVWAHGGSFVAGTKDDGDVVSLCRHFAKRGYVCATINYRLQPVFPLPTQASATQGVYRAVQDMKAAIRYFRKDAATTNTYAIDPNMVFAGGSSAGAFMVLHLAYLDQYSELPAAIDTATLGDLEGRSGNPGYPSTVNAIVNLCGALGDKNWINPGEVPVVSMHGTADNTVPYGTAMLTTLGVQIMVVDGSYSVSQQATSVGIFNEMYTWFGAGHVPYSASTAYMDTTVRFVSNFLYRYMGCTPVDPTPLPNTFPATGISSAVDATTQLHVYPNPATERFTVELSGNDELKNVQLSDLSGRVARSVSPGKGNRFVIEQDGLAPGIYILRMKTDKEEMIRKIIFE